MPGQASWFWRVWSSQISRHRHMKVVPTVFTRQAIFLVLIRPKTYTGELHSTGRRCLVYSILWSEKPSYCGRQIVARNCKLTQGTDTTYCPLFVLICLIMSKTSCLTEALFCVRGFVGNTFCTLKCFNVLPETHEFLHVKHSLPLLNLNKNRFVSADYIEILNIMCHNNLSSDSWIVWCPQTDKHSEAISPVFLLLFSWWVKSTYRMATLWWKFCKHHCGSRCMGHELSDIVSAFLTLKNYLTRYF